MSNHHIDVDNVRFSPKVLRLGIGGVIVIIVIAVLATQFVKSVPAGHVSVATLFGAVKTEALGEGLHFVNPFHKFTNYDVRQKTHMESVGVPSQDQLTTMIEVSVQYRLDESMAAAMKKNTGMAEDMIRVHLIPNVRSVLREQGKTIEKAENFFLEETQAKLQASVLSALQSYCGPKGIDIEAVLLRDIQLPPFITKAIESKKEREQEVEKQKAELERFKTEQEEMIVAAEAGRRAASEDAEKVKLLADARAYEIEALNAAIATNPAYIQLEALKALQAISRDPAAKIYFLNSDSPMPLPLMHMGERE